MKNEFYSDKNNVTKKVMKLAWGILIFDGILFVCLIFLFLCAIGQI